MKKKFEIEIEEKYQKVIEQEAETLEEALEIVADRYDNGEFEESMSENLMDTEIRAFRRKQTLNSHKRLCI